MTEEEQIAALVADLEASKKDLRSLPFPKLATILVKAISRAQPVQQDPYSITDFYRENAR